MIGGMSQINAEVGTVLTSEVVWIGFEEGLVGRRPDNRKDVAVLN